jgi:hypothetical protein
MMADLKRRLERLEQRTEASPRGGRVIVCEVRQGEEDSDREAALRNAGIAAGAKDLVVSLVRFAFCRRDDFSPTVLHCR